MKAFFYILAGLVIWTLIGIAFAGAVTAVMPLFEALKPVLGIAAFIAAGAFFYNLTR